MTFNELESKEANQERLPVLAQMILLGRSELRLLSCAVPDVEYLYTVRLLGDVVEDAIRVERQSPSMDLARLSGRSAR